MENITHELSPEVMEMVEAYKRTLSMRAKYAGLVPDRIAHFVEGDFIFVICNPVITHDELYDEYGPTGEFAPRRNVAMWVRELRIEGNKVVVESGLYPIVAPWLLIRLNLDGSLNADGGNVVRGLKNVVSEQAEDVQQTFQNIMSALLSE